IVNMPPPVKTFGERIADALVEDGLLSTQQVTELLEQQKKEGTRLLKLLTDKSYVSETDLVVSMGRVLGVAPVNLARIGIPNDVAGLLPKEVATNHKVVPVSRLADRLYLARAARRINGRSAGQQARETHYRSGHQRPRE